jgi:two-component system CheB/CheR fusion protein
MAAYLNILRDNPDEARALANDCLISVTAFFRDRDAFASLQQTIKQLIGEKADGETVRAWVPGCATGEEAYSIAILLAETARKQGKLLEFQIFGTDIDEQALATARRGFYPLSISEDVPQAYLAQYFVQQPAGYQVTQELQKSVLFAHHNLLKDPPFSRLDLISCRNLLIYLRRNVQRHLFQIFHYSLKPSGYLFLGSSETVDNRSASLFAPFDKEYRIYQRRVGTGELPRMPDALPQRPTATPAPSRMSSAVPGQDLGELHRRLLLQRFMPPSVIVNRQNEIRHIAGDMKRYLLPPQGQPTYNLLQLVLDPLRLELRSLLFQVFRREQPARSAPLFIEHGDEQRVLHITAEPLAVDGFDEELALVVFEETVSDSPYVVSGPDAESDVTQQAIIDQLEDELQANRHRLQAVIEEYETSNEELKVSNEELQSTNEELFSTTEELQAREEELRSANRELHALNQELQNKVEELNRANSDLENLIEGNSVATIFLDRELNVMRYTPRATDLFHLLPSDVGRPFAHITHELDDGTLPSLARRVLNNLEVYEGAIESNDERWYQLRILPYRTVDDRIDGVVLTFVDITSRRQAEESAYARATQQTVVAELGHSALGGTELAELMDLAVRQVAQALDVEMCELLELRPEDDELLLKAGVGWKEGYVGKATVGTEMNSQAGYTLEVSGPVVVDDLETEKRFNGPDLLRDHHVVSGVTVVIAGREHPYGVIGAHTRRRRRFSNQDAAFLAAVANVLSTAVERKRAETERNELLARVEAERAHLHTLFMQAPASIAMHEGPDHVYTFVNERYLTTSPTGPDMLGKTPRELFPDYAEHELLQAFDQVYKTGEPIVRREELVLFDVDGDGELEENFIDLVLQPIRHGDEIEGVMSFSFDVTSRVKARQQLEEEQKRLTQLAESLEERVNQRTAQVRSLASALSLAEQRERERISQILHDDLQQLLHALHVQLLLVQTDPEHEEVPDLVQKLGELDVLIENALKVTRALTVELSPPILEGEGLNEAFHWLASHMEEIYGLRVVLDLQESPELPSKDLRELVFQMVRELLFNVVKHGDVQEAGLRVSQEGEQYLVEVTDDGAGFDVQTALDQQEQGGFGLSSIQRRLELFGGDMTIDSQKGSGTRVTIFLPSTLASL